MLQAYHILNTSPRYHLLQTLRRLRLVQNYNMSKVVLNPLIFSRKVNAAEGKYSKYDRELLAIYYAIRFFRYFVEGCVVFTDHTPLTYAFEQNHENNSPRQIRHLEFIGQFTTDIRYIYGSANFVADTSSRIAEISFSESILTKCYRSGFGCRVAISSRIWFWSRAQAVELAVIKTSFIL
ncbi:hypothetical protein AVEN_137322-1 [Araneus ventricosus]|uniref:Reverse transcriptase RNase H-like domain-containing protein n=1 Tax=Araneus ventricosus TaxID=182803 RepID=A0A4Y2FJX0_ARAVE|nr:hypothetical protein AVEN_137322-1 [Araneus ventricosus]